MNSRLLCHAVSALLVIAAGGQQVADTDWPQWRGPHRTGIVSEDAGPSAWPADLTKAWSVPVGEGYSSPVSADSHGKRAPAKRKRR